jgi:tetratricopeptide (TPR) repeat protein
MWTSPMEVAGTWPYMAPEVWQPVPAHEKADVYALGCIMLELLTDEQFFRGHGPRHDERREECRLRHEQLIPPVPRLTIAGKPVPDRLRLLIERCLAKNPNTRPTVAELRQELGVLPGPPGASAAPAGMQPEAMSDEEWNQLGTAFHGLGKYDRAVECYDMAIRLDATIPKYYANRGHSLTRLDRVAEAQLAFVEALRVDPANAEALVGMGRALATAKAFDSALECLGRAEQLNPNLPDAFAVRAWVYTLADLPDLALADWRRAERLGRKVEAYLGMADIAYGYGHLARALVLCDKAIAEDPLCWEAHENGARICEALSKSRWCQRGRWKGDAAKRRHEAEELRRRAGGD